MTYNKEDLEVVIEKVDVALRDLNLLEEQFKGVVCSAHVVKQFKEVSDDWDGISVLMTGIFGRELRDAAAYLIPEKNETADFSHPRSKLGWIKREAERILREQ